MNEKTQNRGAKLTTPKDWLENVKFKRSQARISKI